MLNNSHTETISIMSSKVCIQKSKSVSTENNGNRPKCSNTRDFGVRDGDSFLPFYFFKYSIMGMGENLSE